MARWSGAEQCYIGKSRKGRAQTGTAQKIINKSIKATKIAKSIKKLKK